MMIEERVVNHMSYRKRDMEDSPVARARALTAELKYLNRNSYMGVSRMAVSPKNVK